MASSATPTTIRLTLTGDDSRMRMRREIRRWLWGLWFACLAFSIWFLVEVVMLFLQAESW
ncbi:hypothetical protein ADL25_14725 [Streptomyces sp. NRRL F-5122]|nr:hypothetical protein ADL25_14725 [Streptomyces sp. NRRL F-5122]